MAANTRDAIRAAIFSGDNPRTKPKSEFVDLFGEQVEIRQPNLDTILSLQSREDKKQAMVDMLVAYTYVPETNDKVFESGDAEGLLALPFGEDYSRVQAAITKLTNVNIAMSSAEKNSESSPSK